MEPQQPRYALGHHELGGSAARQPAQGAEIEMIVMVVADEHNVDTRKIFPSDARRPAAARTDGAEWTCALRPDRVGEDICGVLLQ